MWRLRLSCQAASCCPPRLVLLAVALLGAVTASGQGKTDVLPSPAAHEVDFRRDIFPLLSQRCFSCHRGLDAESGHRLDVRSSLLPENGSPGLVAAKDSAVSRLIQVVAGKVEGLKMPPEGPPLSGRQIGLLRAWIDQGLEWDFALLPEDAARPAEHWAFQAVRKPEVPSIANSTWVRNPVDAFIAAQHELAKLTPSPLADKSTLIRRLSLNLTGLPPTFAQWQEFLQDDSPRAYENLVERLLASPHYGERFARHWLDLARWAESEGYESNHPRPFAWRYRDYVVNCFNRDKPYPQFLREQIAGDEMLPYDDERLIATGFLAAARLSSNEEDKALQRNDVLVDIVNATGNSILGLTMQCAQCHDHKFDPISQQDYYGLQAFFAKGQPANLVLKGQSLWEFYDAAKAPEYASANELQQVLFNQAKARRIAEAKAKLSEELRQALDTPADQRSAAQLELARQADLKLQFTPDGIERAILDADRPLYNELKKKLAELEKRMPPVPQTWGYYSPATSPTAINVLPMKGFYPLLFDANELKQQRSFVLVRGDVHQRGNELRPAFPAVLSEVTKSLSQHRSGLAHFAVPGEQNVPDPLSADVSGIRTAGVPPDTAGPKTRSELADWLGSERHPLTARVYVNRLWQYHFGRGLVETPNDFGLRGARPTHPQLLDWLAAEFMEHGWSTKHLQRLIVTSNTYRQAGAFSVDCQQAQLDPENRWYWRWPSRRAEAEVIRDAMLAVTGELDPQVGGESVPVEQQADSKRRSLYLFQRRDNPSPALGLFDGPNAVAESCAIRSVSTTALQPLFLLNNRFALDRASALARRILDQAGHEPAEQVRLAFQLALARLPDPQEQQESLAYLEGRQATTTVERLAPFCQALLNLNEFIYVE